MYVQYLEVFPCNSQDDTKFGSSGDDLQAFIDEFDLILMISNQDVLVFYTILTF